MSEQTQLTMGQRFGRALFYAVLGMIYASGWWAGIIFIEEQFGRAVLSLWSVATIICLFASIVAFIVYIFPDKKKT